ncbi:MAG: gamma-glutamylcyclotransferase [Desulfitobacterium hafniense]|nr:gamma-glutamylcyclotransferase [Desulfitobacterium hafniense]
MQPVYYFAYGSCMNEDSISKDVANYQVMGRAVLEDHCLTFTRFSSKWQGGVADVVSRPGQRVDGILYRIPQEEMRNLDRREGAPYIYRRKRVKVQFVEDLVEAVTYEVVDKAPVEYPPAREYADTILKAAEGELSPEYVAGLKERLATW